MMNYSKFKFSTPPANYTSLSTVSVPEKTGYPAESERIVSSLNNINSAGMAARVELINVRKKLTAPGSIRPLSPYSQFGALYFDKSSFSSGRNVNGNEQLQEFVPDLKHLSLCKLFSKSGNLLSKDLIYNTGASPDKASVIMSTSCDRLSGRTKRAADKSIVDKCNSMSGNNLTYIPDTTDMEARIKNAESVIYGAIALNKFLSGRVQDLSDNTGSIKISANNLEINNRIESMQENAQHIENREKIIPDVNSVRFLICRICGLERNFDIASQEEVRRKSNSEFEQNAEPQVFYRNRSLRTDPGRIKNEELDSLEERSRTLPSRTNKISIECDKQDKKPKGLRNALNSHSFLSRMSPKAIRRNLFGCAGSKAASRKDHNDSKIDSSKAKEGKTVHESPKNNVNAAAEYSGDDQKESHKSKRSRIKEFFSGRRSKSMESSANKKVISKNPKSHEQTRICDSNETFNSAQANVRNLDANQSRQTVECAMGFDDMNTPVNKTNSVNKFCTCKVNSLQDYFVVKIRNEVKSEVPSNTFHPCVIPVSAELHNQKLSDDVLCSVCHLGPQLCNCCNVASTSITMTDGSLPSEPVGNTAEDIPEEWNASMGTVKKSPVPDIIQEAEICSNGKRSVCPPQSLSLRKLAEKADGRNSSLLYVGRNTAQISSASIESIGRCSLDLATSTAVSSGSEASLVRNGTRRSSASASKRTLTSHDGVLGYSSTSSTNPMCHTPVSPATAEPSFLIDASDQIDSVGLPSVVIRKQNGKDDVVICSEEHVPSYVKVSHAIGGYSPYNTYSPESTKVIASRGSASQPDIIERQNESQRKGDQNFAANSNVNGYVCNVIKTSSNHSQDIDNLSLKGNSRELENNRTNSSSHSVLNHPSHNGISSELHQSCNLTNHNALLRDNTSQRLDASRDNVRHSNVILRELPSAKLMRHSAAAYEGFNDWNTECNGQLNGRMNILTNPMVFDHDNLTRIHERTSNNSTTLIQDGGLLDSSRQNNGGLIVRHDTNDLVESGNKEKSESLDKRNNEENVNQRDSLMQGDARSNLARLSGSAGSERLSGSAGSERLSDSAGDEWISEVSKRLSQGNSELNQNPVNSELNQKLNQNSVRDQQGEIVASVANDDDDVVVKQNGLIENGIEDYGLDSSGNSDVLRKDGNYFLKEVHNTELKLRSMCVRLEQDLEQELPEEVEGKIRAAVGKANLLVTKKFKQFKGLCEQNLTEDELTQFRPSSEDLAGFWDMVLIQVKDVEEMFSNLNELRENDWIEQTNQEKECGLDAEEDPTVRKEVLRSINGPRPTNSQTKLKTRGVVTPRGGGGGASSAASRASAASKTRELHRQRLAAAKQAGRQRKASAETDDVEIFIS